MTSLRLLAIQLGMSVLLVACSSRNTGSPANTSDSGTTEDMAHDAIDAAVSDMSVSPDAAHDASVVDGSSDAALSDASLTDAQPADMTPDFDSGISEVDAGVCGFVDALNESGCSSDDDCRIGLHQINCCGTHYAVGFKASEEAAFDSMEAVCAASYPRCRCAVGPTGTDSGETVVPGESDAIQVACVSRGPTSVCLTYVAARPADGV